MRGWLVINPTNKPRITIGGHKGTDVSDVDLKLLTHSTDVLGPYSRLKASFRMNGAPGSNTFLYINVCAYLRRAGES